MKLADSKVSIVIEATDNTSGAASKAEQSIKKVEQAAKAVGSKKTEVSVTANDRATSVLDKVKSKAQQVGSKKTEVSVTANDKATSVLDKIKSAAQAVGSKAYELVVSAKDKASEVFDKVKSAAKSIAGKTYDVAISAVDKATSVIDKIKSALFGLPTQLGIAISATAAVKDIMSTGLSYEAGMSNVQAVSGATDTEMGVLDTYAKNEAKRTKFTLTETADALQYMGMAGWTTEQMMSGLPDVLNLAAAGSADLATTSDIVTDVITALGMSAEDVGHFSDVMATAAAKSNTSVDLMGETFKYAAPLAGMLGYSIDDLALATGLMASASVKGSQAGTALRSALVNLAKPTSSMQAVMDKYNLSLANADGSAKSLREIMTDIRAAFKGSSDITDEAGDLATLVGKYGLSGWAAIVNTTDEAFAALADEIDNAAGSAERMAAIQMDNLQGDLLKLQSMWSVVAYDEVYDKRLKPVLRKGVQYLTKELETVPDKVDLLDKLFNDPSALPDTDWWEDYLAAGSPRTIGSKIKFAWDEIVEQPFSEWWAQNKETIVAKIGTLGEGAGGTLGTIIQAIFGQNSFKDAASEVGKTFFSSFWEGLKGSFNADNILEVIGQLEVMLFNAIKEHPLLSLLIGYSIKPTRSLMNGAFGLGKSLISWLFGGGNGNGTGLFSGDTMSVTAAVVNVYGGTVGSAAGAAGDVIETAAEVAAAAEVGAEVAGAGAATAAGATGIGVSAATMAAMAALAIPVAIMAWKESGWNPDNYTQGEKNEKSWEEAGLNPEVYGVTDPSSANALAYIPTEFHSAEGSDAYKARKAAGSLAETRSTGASKSKAAEQEPVLDAYVPLQNQEDVYGPVQMRHIYGPVQETVGPVQDDRGAKAESVTASAFSTSTEKAALSKQSRESEAVEKEINSLIPYELTQKFLKGTSAGELYGPVQQNTGSNEVYGPVQQTDNTSDKNSSSLWDKFVKWLFPSASAAELDEDEIDYISGKGSNGTSSNEVYGPMPLESDGSGSIDSSSLGESVMQMVSDSLAGADAESLGGSEIGAALVTAIGSSLENMDAEALSGLNIGENLINAVGSSLSEMDAESLGGLEIGSNLMAAIGSSLENMDAETLSGLDIGSKVASSIGASLESADFSGVTSGIAEKLAAISEIECAPTISVVDEASALILQAQVLADTFGATTAAAILAANDNASSVISEVTTRLNELDGKTATVTINVQQSGSVPTNFASGTSSAAGGGAIINDEKGGRYTEIVDTGNAFYEFGGRNAYVNLPKRAKVYTAEQREKMLAGLAHYANGKDNDVSFSGGTGGISVSVQLNPTIEITSSGGDEERIASVLKSRFKEMADDVADAIASELGKSFSNMPKTGTVV